MDFTSLMLLRSTPLYWGPRPLFHARQLRDFLLFILDPEKPGFAALGIISPDNAGSRDWLSPREGSLWVDEVTRRVWLSGGTLLKEHGDAISEWVFHEFLGFRADLFIDRRRFEACLQALPSRVPGLEDSLIREITGSHPDLGYYLGFSIDWSHVGKSVLWTPQLRISDFWPVSARLAPPRLMAVPPSSPKTSLVAADILENLFWKQVEKGFRIMRLGFGLGEAGVWVARHELEPPVFYYAEPAEMPSRPEDFLESPACLADLEHLCRVALGTHDPRSSDVIGSFLEGNLLALRRELLGSDRIHPFYLVLPWWSTERAEWIEEVERELLFIADKLFYVEFSAGYRIYDITTDLAMPTEAMALWGGTLDDAAEIVRDLQRTVAFEMARSRQKKEAFITVKHLRALLSRLEAEMLRVTDQVLMMERRWRVAVESTAQFAARAFTAREIPGLRSLIAGLKDFGVYRLTGELTRQASQRARQIRETFAGTEKMLYNMLEQEQQEEREQEERNQRVLGYSLAALAAVTALPIVIGQMDWGELQSVMQDWPPMFSWLGSLMRMVHPYLALIAVIGAAVLISFLTGMLLLALWQPGRRRKSEMEIVGSRLAEAWQWVGVARPMIGLLREHAFVSRRVPDSAVPEIAILRREADEWDRRVCERIVEIWEWILAQREEDRIDPEAGLHTRWQQVRRFIITTEMLDNRPTPLPLPVTLCLFRYKSTDFIASSPVSDFEFEQMLNGYGFEDDEVRAIDQWADQELSNIPRYAGYEMARRGRRLRDLPPAEFVTALREVVGVSALHERTIEPPA
ncbi:MAG TPA: hypothetical protein ENI95_11700 [Chloroflexi bacterium]|nr:hypothetical protein [Chloroflexota bacterium]